MKEGGVNMRKRVYWMVILLVLTGFWGCKEDIDYAGMEHIKYPYYMILPRDAEVTITDIGCDAPGMFLMLNKVDFFLEDSLVYSYNDLLLPYKGQYGKRLRLSLYFVGDYPRYALCLPDSSVTYVRLGSAEIEELN